MSLSEEILIITCCSCTRSHTLLRKYMLYICRCNDGHTAKLPRHYGSFWPGSNCFITPCLFVGAGWWRPQIATRLGLRKITNMNKMVGGEPERSTCITNQSHINTPAQTEFHWDSKHLLPLTEVQQMADRVLFFLCWEKVSGWWILLAIFRQEQ